MQLRAQSICYAPTCVERTGSMRTATACLVARARVRIARCMSAPARYARVQRAGRPHAAAILKLSQA
eukprot:1809247-Prymnesium_polylepis.1